MGKRSDFEKMPKDKYQTPFEAVLPLVPFLPTRPFTYVEPCAGDGRLMKHLEVLAPQGFAVGAFDIEPDAPKPGLPVEVEQKDALTLTRDDFATAPDLIITNPPWSRDNRSGNLLHRLIDRFTEMAPTWLLFDADHMHTVQSVPFADRLVCTVAVGRVKWIEGSTMSGKDNCQWSLFHPRARSITEAPLFFHRNLPPADNLRKRFYPYPFGMRLAA